MTDVDQGVRDNDVVDHTAPIFVPDGLLLGTEDDGQQVRPLPRRVLGLLSVAVAVLCFLQDPGKIVADTKLDIAIAPTNFLSHALYLWDPQQAFGGVPFQAYGFFVPMGPYFALGHSLHLSTWVIQRLWVATLLIAALWGLIRLAEALEIGSRTSRVIAGLAFIFAPPVSLLGATSDFILPFALLPWVILPLVRGSREGSPRVAAARSGVAVLLVGGVNAAATLAVLPVPLLWLLTRAAGRRKRELLKWWVVAVILACTWWAVSLFLEGRYGFNLLPFTETSSTTTVTTSLFNVLRGNTYWVAYDHIGPTAIQSGWEAVTSPLMILAGAVLSGLGLFGLAHRGLKERTWLVATLAVGVLLVGAGYPGLFGGPLSKPFQDLLSGPFALFRNVWKFEPILNIALVLGLAHAISVLSGPVRRAAQTVSRRRSLLSRGRFVVIPLALVAVLGLSLPFLTNKFFPPGSFKKVPNYWQATATWLGHHAGTTTSLVVPGSTVGIYKWGIPNDEPLQWLAQSNWAVRGLIPDSSVGNIETLDAVEQVLDGGVPNPGLSAYLAQTGVRYLVVRNDLAGGAGAPTPLQVHQLLSAEPGVTPVASFGPKQVVHFGPVNLTLHAVTIYKVQGEVQTVTTAPVANSVVVSGGSNALLAMDEVGLNPGDRAVFVAGDNGVATGNQTWVDTDTSPRVGVTYGNIRDNETYVLTRHQNSPITGKPPLGWTIVPGTQHQTVATYMGVGDVTTSSFGSNVLFESPTEQPAAALDGDPDTSWVADAIGNSVGQWLRVDFHGAIDVSHVTLQLNASPQTPRVTEVTVTTANGSRRERVTPSTGPQILSAPAGPTTFLKVTFSKVLPPRKSSFFRVGAGIQELTIPGVTVQKAEVVPNDELKAFSGPTARPPDYVFTSPTPESAYGVGYGGNDQEPQMDRVFTTPRAATYTVSGTVTARPGASLVAYLQSLGQRAIFSQPFHLLCGFGPPVTVDGTTLQTQVSGTFGGLNGFGQMNFSACGAPLALPAGTHTLQGNAGGILKVVSVALQPATTTPFAAATSAPRTATIENWGTEHRTVAVSAGAATYLIVRQNFNTGWDAKMNGKTLKPVQINGWQQAWVVPAGSSGTVTLSYGPDLPYQIGLIVGGILALLLVGLALWPSRRRTYPDAVGRIAPLPTAAALAGAAVVLFIMGGAFVLLLPALLGLAWFLRSRRWLPGLALVAYLVAGFAVAVAVRIGTQPANNLGAFGRPAQIASEVALAAVLSAFVVNGRWPKRAKRRHVDGAEPPMVVGTTAEPSEQGSP